jgi:hypothetical protein
MSKQKGHTGYWEVSLSEPALEGGISAYVFEEGGVAPTNIIRTDQNWGVKIEWFLKGSLVPFICGYWCVSLHFESMGSPIGPDFNEDEFDLKTYELKLDPCKKLDEYGRAVYDYEFKVPAYTIKPEHCGRPYKVVTSVTYKTICNKPGPMAGFVEGPMIQFYSPEQG